MCMVCDKGNMSLNRGFSKQKDDNDYIELAIVLHGTGFYLCAGTLNESKYETAVTKINYCPMCR